MPTTDAYRQIADADLPSDWCRAELRQTVRTIMRQWREDRRYEPACDNWMKGLTWNSLVNSPAVDYWESIGPAILKY